MGLEGRGLSSVGLSYGVGSVSALQAFKAALGHPSVLDGWVQDPCSLQAPWVGVTCQLGNQLTFVTQL